MNAEAFSLFAKVEHGRNIAEELVKAGLATVIRHRMDEERSAKYDALMAAETA